MKKRFALFFVLALLLTLPACGSGEKAEMNEQIAVNKQAAVDDADLPEGDGAEDAYYYTGGEEAEVGNAANVGDAADTVTEPEGAANKKEKSTPSAYQNAEVKLIRRASLNLETQEFDAAVSGLEKLTANMGGYVESSSVNQGSYGSTYRSASYTIRVPSGKYSAFLNRVSGDKHCHLVDKDESTQDVGQEYFDTESRLKTLRTKLERLQALLKKADKMEDIIKLENAIGDTEYEIDQYTSTLKRYDSLVGYATFDITLEQVNAISDTDANPYGVRLRNAFVGGFLSFGRGMQSFSLWLAENLLVILLLVLIVLGIRYLLRRRRLRRQREGWTKPERRWNPFGKTIREDTPVTKSEPQDKDTET